MNHSLKLAAKFIGCLILLAVSPLASAGLIAAAPATAVAADKCATKYDPKDPIIARYEQVANVKPLVPSKWEAIGAAGLNFNFENVNQDVVVRVTAIPEAQKQELIDQTAKAMHSVVAATATINLLLAAGFPFNARLCARPDNSLYIDLIGTGGATGKNGKIEIKPAVNSISVTGVIAGGQIDGAVQVQK